jgi:hypothetical protein
MEIRQELLRLQMQRQHEVERLVGAPCCWIVLNPDEEPLLHRQLRNWMIDKFEIAALKRKASR